MPPGLSLSYSEPAKPEKPAGGRRRLPIVRVVDFAFPSTDDERRVGQGPDTPRANIRHNKRHSTMSTVSASTISSSGSTSEEEEEEEEDENGWGGGWSIGFGTGTGPGLAGRTASWANAAGPSQGDLMRGFTGFEDDDDEEDHDVQGYMHEEEQECVPGLYRAAYAFESEGAAEMSLAENQVVRIIGRGGGAGWAIALRPPEEGGGHALVPEAYLELVKAEADESLDEEGNVSGLPLKTREQEQSNSTEPITSNGTLLEKEGK